MRSLNDYFLTAYIADVSTAGQIYVAVPDDGRVTKVFTALNGTIDTANSVITVKTARGTCGTLTITASGSAAGDVDSATFSANNQVLEGETIEIETDGGSGQTIPVMVTIVVTR